MTGLYCGNRKVVGHNDYEVCGKQGYSGIYQCESCQLKASTARIAELESQLGKRVNMDTNEQEQS